jgi:hypothetical protein
MQQIWVSGNPFIRTHPTNYRTSIFNFFRATSGFTEDVMVDGSLPGLVERRYLIDRVMERPPPLPATQRLQSPPPLHPHRNESTTPTDLETQTLGRNARKKKTNRLRVISLDDRTNTPTPQDIRKVDPPTPGARGDATGDEYRRRLEALREEAGAGWLRVLSESGGLAEKAVKDSVGRT